MKKILLFLLIFTLIPTIFSCKGKENKDHLYVIRIATDASWPPMEFIDENGKISGFDIDLMKAAGQAAGYKVEFINVEWDDIFNGLLNDKYDAVCSAVTITEERKAIMDFSLPYLNAGQVLVLKKDNNKDKTLADMKGKEVGALVDTTGSVKIQGMDGIILKTYEEIEKAFFDLAAGKISGVVADVPVAAEFVIQNEEYKNKLKIVGEPFTDEFYGVAVKKGNKKVLDLINAGLMKVIESGKSQKLINIWLR